MTIIGILTTRLVAEMWKLNMDACQVDKMPAVASAWKKWLQSINGCKLLN